MYSLLVPGGFLDSQTGDTQFFEFTQYRCPYYQESQTEDGECEIYSSSPWRPTQNVKEESVSPSLSDSPPRKKSRIDFPEDTSSPFGVKREALDEDPVYGIKAKQVQRGAPKETEKAHELGRDEITPNAIDMHARSLSEEKAAEEEIERKAKEVLERLKNATEELQSLETDAIIERRTLNAAEAQAAKSRDKITQLELVSQTVRKELLDYEGQLGVLVMTKFRKRLLVRVALFSFAIGTLI